MMYFTDLSAHDWVQTINSKAQEFKGYLKEILGDQNFSLLDEFSHDVDIYIFSGIIKDFILEKDYKPRDLDITYRGRISRKWKYLAEKNFDIAINHFGGYKLHDRNAFACDIWRIDDTYGIDKNKRVKSPNDLLDLVFLNLTSIVFDYSVENFIYDKRFLNFLSSKSLEIVNRSNPDPELCFLNIYHNYRKYDIELGSSVLDWSQDFFENGLTFDDVQLRHFHTEVYSNIEILNFISDKLLNEKYL